MKSKKRPIFPFLSSRSGMELAINTLVVMILGVIIVGGGIYFLQVILTGTQDLPNSLTAGQRNEINRQISNGQLVAVAPMMQSTPNAKLVTFGIVIDNRLNADKNYTINISFSTENPNYICVGNWSIMYMKGMTVKQNERGTALVSVGAKKGMAKDIPAGTYTFLVAVTYKDDSGQVVLYDSKRFFTVVVE